MDCALQMLKELRSLRGRDQRFADIDIGIGIAPGQAVVGNFGGERRFDFSAIGDTVNLASRFESITRHFKVHLLVTEGTFIEASGNYLAREVGLVKVKGKAQTVTAIEIVGCNNDGVDPPYYDEFSRRCSWCVMVKRSRPAQPSSGCWRKSPPIRWRECT